MLNNNIFNSNKDNFKSFHSIFQNFALFYYVSVLLRCNFTFILHIFIIFITGVFLLAITEWQSIISGV